MPLGAGFCRSGSSPAGFGSPDVAPINVIVPLPDPVTGASQTGRLINYSQQGSDYAFTSDGRISGMTTMQQNVLLALLNAQIFYGLEDQGPNFQRIIAGRVQNALATFIRQKWIVLVGVDIAQPSSNPDASGVTVRWRDLTIAPTSRNATTTPGTYSTAIPST